MRSFEPAERPQVEVFRTLLSGVAPRPIALVATHDEQGAPNLSPFSFFNAFGSNPPIVVFSPSYRGRDGSSKDTFRNILATGECTISAVSFAMVEQISLASSEYDSGVDEFVKSGLTPLPSRNVAPPGVAESPFVLECKLLQHIDTGGKPGAGNLMICKVVRFHVSESAYDENDKIDPQRLDLVARMGYNYYCRASGDAVFELPKPTWNGIGIDNLPDYIRNSRYLTGNYLGMLAGVADVPDQNIEFTESLDGKPEDHEIELRVGDPMRALSAFWPRRDEYSIQRQQQILHRIAALFLEQRRIDEAWQTLLLDG